MANKQQTLSELYESLGYKRLNRTWAKLEILLGLSAAGTGLLLGDWAFSRDGVQVEWMPAATGLSLFVFGGYLAMAGHRSHLYQSSNEQTAYLAEILHSHERKEAADES